MFFSIKVNPIYNEEKTIIFLNSATKYRVAKFFKFHKIMGYLFYCPLVHYTIAEHLPGPLRSYTEVIDY